MNCRCKLKGSAVCRTAPLKHTQQPLQALCKPLASPLQAVCKPLHFICKPRLSACLNLCVSAILGFCKSRPTTLIIILIRFIVAKMDPKSCSAPRPLQTLEFYYGSLLWNFTAGGCAYSSDRGCAYSSDSLQQRQRRVGTHRAATEVGSGSVQIARSNLPLPVVDAH